MSDATTTDPQRDEADIRQSMNEWSAALEAKDVGALTKNYDPDAVLFDACPPYKTVGVAGIKQV